MDGGIVSEEIGYYSAGNSKACAGIFRKNWYYRSILSNGIESVPLSEFLKCLLIGYELIKPEYEAAVTKIVGKVLVVDDTMVFTDHTHIEKLRIAGVLDLWFKPVYKKEEPKEVELEVKYDEGVLHVTVSKKGIYCNTQEQWLNPSDLRNTFCQDSVSGVDSTLRYSPNANAVDNIVGNWTITFTKVSIGCRHGISVEDIAKVYKAYDELQ